MQGLQPMPRPCLLPGMLSALSMLRRCRAGREDMDVRMLGGGRPFAIEIINARVSSQPDALYRSVETQLDKVCPDVHQGHGR